MAEHQKDRMDASEVAELLQGAILDGFEIATVNAEASDLDALVIKCDFTEAFDYWSELRNVVGQTRRWPVFLDDWMENLNLETDELPFLDHGFPGRHPTLRSLNQQQQDLEWRAICDELNLDPDSDEAPGPAVAAQELGEDVTLDGLSQWVLRWQLDRGQIDPELLVDRYHGWGPLHGTHTALVLLPTDQSQDALTYLHWYPARDREEYCRTMFRSWNERFEAEIWAVDGVQLEMNVKRPPTDIETAWSLASEQVGVAGLTIGGRQLDYAGGLVGRNRWTLYDRP